MGQEGEDREQNLYRCDLYLNSQIPEHECFRWRYSASHSILDLALYHRAFSLSAQWELITAIIISFTIFVLGDQIVALFTTIEDVRIFTSGYLIWMVVFPVVGYWGPQLEGIFSGATEAKSLEIQ